MHSGMDGGVKKRLHGRETLECETTWDADSGRRVDANDGLSAKSKLDYLSYRRYTEACQVMQNGWKNDGCMARRPLNLRHFWRRTTAQCKIGISADVRDV